jgi:hypothetical protein
MADAFEKQPHMTVSSVVDHAQRRKGMRYGINADTEVEEPRTQAKVIGRTSDLGSGGCYVDSLTTFPIGTEVCVRIKRSGQTFEATARVLYGKPGMGMGMAFVGIVDEEKVRLEHWINELSRETAVAPIKPSPVVIKSREGTEGVVLSQLIKLLMRKGMLSQSEAEGFRRELDRNAELRED